jgi:alcohol sulfotransferase
MGLLETTRRIHRWLTMPDLLSLKQPVFLCSYPKSGRTWLRFIIASYLNTYFRLGIDLDLRTVFKVIPNDGLSKSQGLPAYAFANEPDVPLFVCSHEEHRPSAFDGHKRVFLIRSVYDVLVSDYFHVSRQHRKFEGSISAFVRNDELGAGKYIRYLNSWTPRLSTGGRIILTYENLSADTEAEVARVLRFANVPIEPAALTAAVAHGAFDRMREIEREKGIAGHTYDRSDEGATRVRRGMIGGYVDYLEDDDIVYIRDACEEFLSSTSKELLEYHGLLPSATHDHIIQRQ